eukprot:scaffold3685_cov21-Tisochrysis_lutea.AAC.10
MKAIAVIEAGGQLKIGRTSSAAHIFLPGENLSLHFPSSTVPSRPTCNGTQTLKCSLVAKSYEPIQCLLCWTMWGLRFHTATHPGLPFTMQQKAMLNHWTAQGCSAI